MSAAWRPSIRALRLKLRSIMFPAEGSTIPAQSSRTTPLHRGSLRPLTSPHLLLEEQQQLSVVLGFLLRMDSAPRRHSAALHLDTSREAPLPGQTAVMEGFSTGALSTSSKIGAAAGNQNRRMRRSCRGSRTAGGWPG